MSGGTEICLFTASAIAVITDLIWGKIYNWLTLPVLVLGLGLAAWSSGWGGLSDALLGAAAGLFLFGWMFALRAVGGGDVKFAMALGALGGWRFSVEAAVLSVLLGGACSIAFLASRGKLPDFLRRMQAFIYTIVVKEMKLAPPEIDSTLKMPFGLAIAAAAAWTALAHPLERWGMLPWN